MTANEQPISALDKRLDDLACTLALISDLPGLIEGLRSYERLLAMVRPDDPAVVSAVGVSAVWRALADVAVEVAKVQTITRGA